ncbi:ABC transporter ATP-binding protein [Lampropedia aestuarii]|nr:ABC transporter ATP-binding protein [Lampropedia aestuarii]
MQTLPSSMPNTRVASAPISQLGASIEVQQLKRQFGTFEALRGIDFSLPAGRVLALLGPSGCGKSTLLKLLAGLDRPSSGSISLGGRLVADAKAFVPPQQRKLGMVFQDYALWPHMSVAGNVGFALRMQGLGGRELDLRVERVLQQVGLASMGKRAPSALSGGQQQRVALARAIVAQPALLLFDEPLSNLDRDLRESLCGEIGQLLREMGTTAVYVTHDHEEACAIADEVAVMFHGQIAQRSSAQQLWGAPAHIDVARFLKLGALLPAWHDGQTIGLAEANGSHTVATWPAAWLAPTGAAQTSAAQRVPGHVLVPEDAIRLTAVQAATNSAQEPKALVLPAQVVEQQYTSGRYRTRLQLVGAGPEHHVHAWTRERLSQAQGSVALQVDPAQMRWFAAQAA